MKMLKKILFILALVSTHFYGAELPQQPAEPQPLASYLLNMPQHEQSYLRLLPRELRLELLKKVAPEYLSTAFFWAVRKQEIAWNKEKLNAPAIEQNFSLPGTTFSNPGFASSITFNRQATLYALGFINGTIIIKNLQTNQPVSLYQPHEAQVAALAFNPTSTLLATASLDMTAKIFRVATGELIRTLENAGGSLDAISFNDQGTLLATGSRSGKLIIWEVATGNRIREIDAHYSTVSSIAFDPTGRYLATGSYDDSVKIWNINEPNLFHEMTGHDQAVHVVTFNPTGTLLASASNGATILWNTETGTLKKHLHGKNLVRSIAFNSTGNLVAAGTHAPAVAIWEVDTGKILAKLNGHTAGISGLIFSPDGSALITGTLPANTIRTWILFNPKDFNDVLEDKIEFFNQVRQMYHRQKSLDLNDLYFGEKFRSLSVDWQDVIRKTVTVIDEESNPFTIYPEFGV